jgi:hypothetical protein
MRPRQLAVRWRHLGVNTAALARAPSPSRPEPDPPSAAEAAALLNAAWADPDWRLLLWLTMVTGTPRGEVSALRWSHVDFDRGSLLVQRPTHSRRPRPREGDEDWAAPPGGPGPADHRPYELIAADLRGRVERGEPNPGDHLPTVVELAKAHTVAVGTTHRAVAFLRDEGLVDVSRGRRATVNPAAECRSAGHHSGWGTVSFYEFRPGPFRAAPRPPCPAPPDSA